MNNNKSILIKKISTTITNLMEDFPFGPLSNVFDAIRLNDSTALKKAIYNDRMEINYKGELLDVIVQLAGVEGTIYQGTIAEIVSALRTVTF